MSLVRPGSSVRTDEKKNGALAAYACTCGACAYVCAALDGGSATVRLVARRRRRRFSTKNNADGLRVRLDCIAANDECKTVSGSTAAGEVKTRPDGAESRKVANGNQIVNTLRAPDTRISVLV